MSDLDRQFRTQVESFISRHLSFDELYLWVAEYAPDLADSSDLWTRQLQARVWGLIGEYGYGNVSEDAMRIELQNTLPGQSRILGRSTAFVINLIGNVWISPPNTFALPPFETAGIPNFGAPTIIISGDTHASERTVTKSRSVAHQPSSQLVTIG